PELTDAQISRLIGTTKPTIASVRDRSHWNATNIKPQNPVTLGLCTEAELEKAVVIAQRRASNAEKAAKREAARREREAKAAADAANAPPGETAEAEETGEPEPHETEADEADADEAETDEAEGEPVDHDGHTVH